LAGFARQTLAFGGCMKHIVKRAGHTEEYDERKLYASIYASCLSVRETAPTAEMVAGKVCKDVNNWLDKKTEVTSHDIRLNAAKHLDVYNPDAAWIYKHHRNIS
jgi:transcriptional regulator NrdR family protein